MDKPRTRVKFIIVSIILTILVIFLFEIPNVFSAGDPPYNKQRHIMEVDAQSTVDENFNPEVDDNTIKVKTENKIGTGSNTTKESKKPAEEKTEANNENIQNITEGTTTEGTIDSEIADIPSTNETVSSAETETETETTEPEVSESNNTEASDSDISVENTEDIENIVAPEVSLVVEKFVPQGPYTSPDFSIYSEDELQLLQIVLGKINENKNTDKKDEIIDVDFTMSLESYYKVATYFYVYYGQKRAVDETFDLINHTSYTLDGTKETKYMIRMRYEDIREFEKELQLVKDKTDGILSNLEAGNDEYILKQISEYLRLNIVYTAGNYDIKSALIDGQCVCNGYALAFNMLANRAGIKTDMCIGEVPGSGMHAWNRVTMSDGNQYFYDITFYDTNNPNNKYIHSPTPLHTTDYLINDYVDCWFRD